MRDLPLRSTTLRRTTFQHPFFVATPARRSIPRGEAGRAQSRFAPAPQHPASPAPDPARTPPGAQVQRIAQRRQTAVSGAATTSPSSGSGPRGKLQQFRNTRAFLADHSNNDPRRRNRPKAFEGAPKRCETQSTFRIGYYDLLQRTERASSPAVKSSHVFFPIEFCLQIHARSRLDAMRLHLMAGDRVSPNHVAARVLHPHHATAQIDPALQHLRLVLLVNAPELFAFSLHSALFKRRNDCR